MVRPLAASSVQRSREYKDHARLSRLVLAGRALPPEPPVSSRPTASSSIAAQRQRGPAAVEPGAAAARPPVHAPVEALTVQY